MPHTHRRLDQIDDAPAFHRDVVVDGWRFTCEPASDTTYRLTISDTKTDPAQSLHDAHAPEEVRRPAMRTIRFTGDATFAERAMRAAVQHRESVFSPGDLLHDMEAYFQAERHPYERVWEESPEAREDSMRVAWQATKDAVRRQLTRFGIVKDAPTPPESTRPHEAKRAAKPSRGKLHIVRKPE